MAFIHEKARKRSCPLVRRDAEGPQPIGRRNGGRKSRFATIFMEHAPCLPGCRYTSMAVHWQRNNLLTKYVELFETRYPTTDGRLEIWKQLLGHGPLLNLRD